MEPHCLPTHVVPVAQFAFSMQVDGWQIPPRQALFGGKQSVSAVHLRAAITNMCRYPNKWTRIPHLHISDKSFSMLYSGCIQSLYSFVKKKKRFQQFYDNLWLGYYFLNSLFIIYCKWICITNLGYFFILNNAICNIPLGEEILTDHGHIQNFLSGGECGRGWGECKGGRDTIIQPGHCPIQKRLLGILLLNLAMYLYLYLDIWWLFCFYQKVRPIKFCRFLLAQRTRPLNSANMSKLLMQPTNQLRQAVLKAEYW